MGLHAIPAGDASEAARSLLNDLAACGVHIVEAGEMESFIKVQGGHGPEWVVRVVEKKLWQSCDLARRLVKSALGMDTSNAETNIHL